MMLIQMVCVVILITVQITVIQSRKIIVLSQGNGIGDACDCEGNFDCDSDCDGTDAASFKTDFGRSGFLNPCINESQCHGDFDCDADCDGTDAALFKTDFGRSLFSNPCPACVVWDWCVYE